MTTVKPLKINFSNEVVAKEGATLDNDDHEGFLYGAVP